MADNFFDKFDEKPAPTAPTTVAPAASGNFFDQFEGGAAPAAATPARPWSPSDIPSNILQGVKGAADLLYSGATGAVASIPAGLAYGGAAIGEALGADVNPRQVMQNVQSYLTHHPTTEGAQQAGQIVKNVAAPVVTPVVRKLDQAATAVGRVSPMGEKMLREAPYAFQAASGVLPVASIADAARVGSGLNAEAKALAATRNPTPEELAVSKAQDLGLKLLPSQQGRTPGAIAEGLSGQAKLERTLSKQNAAVVDAAAAEEVGLPAGAKPTKATLAQKAAEASSVYKDVSRLGQIKTDPQYAEAIANLADRSGAGSFAEDTPAAITRLKEIYGSKSEFDAADAVIKVRQLRADASKNLKAPNAPEQNALGYAQRQLANILDEQMERAAAERGQADLVSRYRAARVQLAKIHSVEDAIRGSNVSAKALAKQKARGVPLSGKLSDIADAYNSFDRVLQEPGKIRDSGPLGVVDYLVGAGAALHNPLLATAALSRPLVRNALASDFYQNLQRGALQETPFTEPVGALTIAPAAAPAASPAVQAMLDAARRRQP
jgi:hypothetical protein